MHSSQLRLYRQPACAAAPRHASKRQRRCTQRSSIRVQADFSYGPTLSALEAAVKAINKVVSMANIKGGENDKKPQPNGKGKWVRMGASSSGSARAGPMPAASATISTPAASTATTSSSLPTVDAATSGASISNAASTAGANSSSSLALSDYLALPVEQYVLLDPSMVTREANNVFRIDVPVREVTGIDLDPVLWLAVDIQPEKGKVVLELQRAVLGREQLDRDFELSVSATLSARQARRKLFGFLRGSSNDSDSSNQLQQQQDDGKEGQQQQSRSNGADTSSTAPDISNRAASAGTQEEEEAGAETIGSDGGSSRGGSISSGASAAGQSSAEEQMAQPAGGSRGEAGEAGGSGGQQQQQQQQQELHCEVQITMRVLTSPQLQVVPGPMLSLAGNLVLKAIMQGMLPSVLGLLVRDYQAWARGDKRSDNMGRLLPSSSSSATSSADASDPASPSSRTASSLPLAIPGEAGSSLPMAAEIAPAVVGGSEQQQLEEEGAPVAAAK